MTVYKSQSTTKIPWLAMMPSHWDTLRAKYMFKKESRVVSEFDDVVTCFRDGTVTLRKNRRVTGFTESIIESGYQAIRKGDLVIHVMDAFAGAVGVSDSDGKGTPVYSVCTAKGDFNNYYYAYVVREMAKTGFIQSLYRGIRQRSSDFRFEVFAAQYLPIPPRFEQDQIVRYLDWQVSKTNKLISALRKQIALLKEQKQAIINEAVTKGLDPSALMKDSGVEWIGDIPEHWDIIKLRRILKPVSVKNHPDLPLLSVVRELGVIIRDVEDTESNHNFIPDDLSNNKVVRKGQFAMNKMKAWQGSYGISPYTGIVSSAYFIFDVNFPSSAYFHYAIRSKVYVNFFAQSSDGIRVGQWDLNMQKMKEIPFIVPSVIEQDEIVTYIQEANARIEKAIDSISREIALLREYRTRLISDVVTGQIDVRDVAVPEFEYVSDEIDDVVGNEEKDTEEPEGEEA